MTLWRLIIKEIRLRKITFVLGIVSVLITVGVLVTQLTLLDLHDLRTQQILEEKQEQIKAEMARMEDDYRKIMKKLGYNLLILPENQSLEEFYSKGYATYDMPEDYVEKLTNSGIVTIQHLLPSLEQQIQWPEQGQRNIILVGIRGEVPYGRAIKEPMMLPVPTDEVVLGHEIWSSLGSSVGDRITLLGKEFVVKECNPERGSKDDITVWVDLKQAQELLGRRGRLNAIVALKCHCAGGDLPSIRKEIGAILPGVQVIAISNRVITRAEARDRAKVTAKTALEAERAGRERLRKERQTFAAWFIPTLTLGAAILIGLLVLTNVRERKIEIGILRALGLRSGQIMLIFLAKAFLMGFLGSLIGYGLGFAIGLLFGEVSVNIPIALSIFKPGLLLLVLFLAPLLSIIASWVPALMAANQEPALVLREE